MDPVGSIIAAIAVCGVMGLCALGLAERMVPFIPSYGMLAAIGAASAEGVWPLWVAISATTLGGMLGLAVGVGHLGQLGPDRARAVFLVIARPMGFSDERAGVWAVRAQASTARIALSRQLIPTVRVLATILAVLAERDRFRFLAASAFGVGLWNSVFIGVGIYCESPGRDGGRLESWVRPVRLPAHDPNGVGSRDPGVA